jgi:DNA-binding protein H-NS
MANLDLHDLSLSELKKLEKTVASAIATHDQRQRAEVLALVEARARELGVNLADLAGIKKRRKTSAATGPKYRHPDNPEITWSGKGRRPRWFLAALEAGRSPESLAT